MEKLTNNVKAVKQNNQANKSNNNLLGAFLIILKDTRTEPKAWFLYLDLSDTNPKILNSQIHEGGGYYRAFITFIYKTLSDNILNKNNKNVNGDIKNKILAPKYFVNATMIKTVESINGVKIERYIDSDKYLPESISIVKSVFKSVLELSPEKFNEIIEKFNVDMAKANREGVGLCYKGSKLPANIINKLSNKSDGLNKGLNTNCLKQHGSTRNKRAYSTNSHFFTKIDNAWTNWAYNKDEGILLEPTKFFDLFVEAVIKPKELEDPNFRLGIQLRIKLGNNTYRSISNVDIVDSKNYMQLRDIYNNLWSLKTDTYKEIIIENPIFYYKFLTTDINTKITDYYPDVKKVTYQPAKLINNMPNNMDILKWGKIVSHNKELVRIDMLFKAPNDPETRNLVIDIVQVKNKNFVTVSIKQLGGLFRLFQFTDTLIKHNKKLNTFRRTWNDKIITFVKGEIQLLRETIETQFISQLKKQHKPNHSKIIAMDIETREIDGRMEVVCISIAINTKTPTVKSFAIWDFNSTEELITTAFKYILKSKYHGYSIYFHNFSKFDSVFIFKHIINLPFVEVIPLHRDGRMLVLNIYYGLNQSKKGNAKFNYSVKIFDSFLIQPSSLAKLGKIYGHENKGIFPLKMLNDKNVSFDYKGSVPPIQYFYQPNTLKADEYHSFISKYNAYKNDYINKDWCLKRELINYCEQDVKTLLSVMTGFADIMYKKFSVNVYMYPSAPSITFATYRINYLKDNIPQITGRPYDDMRQAYYGGYVDVYKPYAENVHCYDVNSLYPASMCTKDMPMGKIDYFEGPITSKNFCGIVYANIKAPNIKYPILPTKVKIKNAWSTLYTTGTWSGWYYHDELKNAAKYGYEYEILRGYIFNSANIFADYVNELYKIKQSVTPTDPWYATSKLLLNSLYGRFGMDPTLLQNAVIESEQLDNYIDKHTVVEVVDFGAKQWITYEPEMGGDFKPVIPNVSVAVAIAITAESRIHMSKFIMKYQNDICAIDTDGIKLTCELPKSEVGPHLGQMKDEGTFKEAVFIAPKVYGGITTDNAMVVKVKGLKDMISYWQLKLMLYLPYMRLSNSKWIRDIKKSTIYVKEQLYTLAATANKRMILRDSCGKYIDNLPYELKDGLLVLPNNTILYYLAPIAKYLELPIPVKYLQLPIPDKYLQLPIPVQYPSISAPFDCSPNVIYMPAPIPEVIYMPCTLPSIIYIAPTNLNKNARSLCVYDTKLKSVIKYNSIRDISNAYKISRRSVSRLAQKNPQLIMM